MKRLVALMMCAVSLGAAAQFPSLPYNPDDNGDGLIGVADLQGLLANYGNEFASAVSSNGAAMIQLGPLSKAECMTACNSLPGNWTIPTSKFLMLHVDLVHEVLDLDPNQGDGSDYFWAENNGYTDDAGSVDEHRLIHGVSDYDMARLQSVSTGGGLTGTRIRLAPNPSEDYYDELCLCAIQEKPHVEYFLCSTGAPSDLQNCVDEKVLDGWYPMGAPQYFNSSGNSWVQALWRWAE